MSMTKIQQVTLTSQATITFSSIPTFYSDLLIVASLRDSSGEEARSLIAFNGVTTGFSSRHLTGDGTTASTGTDARLVGFNRDDVTVNTFNNVQIYIPNYSGSTNKSFSVESVTENNATSANQHIIAGLWSNTAAINSITLSSSANNFRVGSSATLYGINQAQAAGRPKAVGGNITFANGYWVHTFTGSGTFSAQSDLRVDALVVAGGGATSRNNGRYGGGGGAGGLLTASNLSVPRNSSTVVVVGAGGSGALAIGRGTSGSPSSAFSLTSIGGGSGGIGSELGSPNGDPGGSGGGGTSVNGSGGAGTAGQGFAGGATSTGGASGGGGASAAGQGQQGSNGGAGGDGAFWGGQAYAGGGGGGGSIGGAGGLGGGGTGSREAAPGNNGTAGTANTGGGGGGAFPNQSTIGAVFGNNGGSGVVIIRYRAD